jgi:aldehyde:ferredoxin oxidoreductase
LKYAGYDKVILRGKSPDLVYLWINNDKVEIRDASHLRGKGAIETAELLRKELKEPKAQVAAIGLAGENRVYYASIEQGRSSASRGGIGAVMGDKGFKAIVVRGTKDVNIARPAEFMELCNEVLEYIKFRDWKIPFPGVMPILAGLGFTPGDESPRREVAYREFHVGQFTPPAEKISGRGNRKEWTETQ